MLTYRIETGDLSPTGVWTSGSYSMLFETTDLAAAKIEADRRLADQEIKAFETGSAIRVSGSNEVAIRTVPDGVW